MSLFREKAQGICLPSPVRYAIMFQLFQEVIILSFKTRLIERMWKWVLFAWEKKIIKGFTPSFALKKRLGYPWLWNGCNDCPSDSRHEVPTERKWQKKKTVSSLGDAREREVIWKKTIGGALHWEAGINWRNKCKVPVCSCGKRTPNAEK